MLRRTATMIGGIILLFLGVLALFIPILPTSPFVLLAIALFAKESPQFKSWTMRNRYLTRILNKLDKNSGPKYK